MWNYYILALVLWPVEPEVASQQSPEVWQALKHVALVLEIVGPHENWATDFRSELRYVRHHYRQLQDAPRLADAGWLPPYAFARELCCFNESYQAHLQVQGIIYLHKCDDISLLLGEARQLHYVWDCARRAATPNESWASRRQNLQRLREVLGEEAYYNGAMPPWVPLWRFQGID